MSDDYYDDDYDRKYMDDDDYFTGDSSYHSGSRKKITIADVLFWMIVIYILSFICTMLGY